MQAPNGKRNRPDPLRHRAGDGRVGLNALAGRELGADRLIGALGPLDLLLEVGTLQEAQIAVLPTVVGDFEQRIGDQLARSLVVAAKPFAADEQRRLDLVCAQIVDNGTVIAGDFARLLAKIEGQRDELAPLRQLHPADCAAQGVGHGSKARERKWRIGAVEAAVALGWVTLAGARLQLRRCEAGG